MKEFYGAQRSGGRRDHVNELASVSNGRSLRHGIPLGVFVEAGRSQGDGQLRYQILHRSAASMNHGVHSLLARVPGCSRGALLKITE